MTDVLKKIEDDKAVWTAGYQVLSLVESLGLSPQQRVEAMFAAMSVVAVASGWPREKFRTWFLGSLDATFDGLERTARGTAS